MSHVQNTPITELPADDLPDEELVLSAPSHVPPLLGRRPGAPRRGRQTVSPELSGGQAQLTPQQRLLVLDTWMKSGLTAGDFAPLVGVSKHTLYA